MKHNKSIKKRILFTTLLLGISVFVVWLFFYVQSVSNIKQMNKGHLDHISGLIVTQLEEELFQMERLALTLSGNSAVVELVKETSAPEFHTKTASVDTLLKTLTDSGGFPYKMILYDYRGNYANFLENFAPETVIQLYDMYSSKVLPRYTAVTLEGTSYIGYGASITQDGEQIGTLLLLREEKYLYIPFGNDSDGISISLAEDGTIVTSSNNGNVGISSDEIKKTAPIFQSRSMRFAPFEIIVSVAPSYFFQATQGYALAALVTVLLIIIFLFVYLAAANRYFVRPLFNMVRNVEQLGLGQNSHLQLKETGIPDFDGLVRQVNLMLKRLDERSKALLASQTRLKNAEIERQAALIVSLKTQINAHFVVNILNIIKALSEHGETQKAALMSDGLSYLLRYTNAEDEFISGMEEQLILEKYVTMMEIRYQDRFVAEFDWSDLLMYCSLPRMLIQPLVENAIVHGFSNKTSGGKLLICGKIEGDDLLIRIEDNGCGMDEKRLKRLQTEIESSIENGWNVGGLEHVALPNIARRLHSYYGSQGRLCIQSKEGVGTSISLQFPKTLPRHADNAH